MLPFVLVTKIVKSTTKLNLKPNSSSAGGGGRVGVEATAALAAHLFGGKLNFLGSYFFTGNYLTIMAVKAGCLPTQWEGQTPFLRQRSKRCTPEMTKSGGQVASHPASFSTCVQSYIIPRDLFAHSCPYIFAPTHTDKRVHIRISCQRPHTSEPLGMTLSLYILGQRSSFSSNVSLDIGGREIGLNTT